MTTVTKQIYKNIVTSPRFKSFLWRTSMMVLAVVISELNTYLTALEMSTTVIVVVGLILGEVSKFINQTLQQSKP